MFRNPRQLDGLYIVYLHGQLRVHLFDVVFDVWSGQGVSSPHTVRQLQRAQSTGCRRRDGLAGRASVLEGACLLRCDQFPFSYSYASFECPEFLAVWVRRRFQRTV